MIEIRNLDKEYKNDKGDIIRAIENLNLKVNSGEIFGIIGPSGAGKSTLIRLLNLLEKPTAGSIEIDGVDLTELDNKRLRETRQKIGMIFQNFNLLSTKTVKENIIFPLKIAGKNKSFRRKRAEELMELVDLSDRADHYPAQLSGGQKQRVGIARALANEPKLLLSDEATSSLDPDSTESILNLLRDIQKEMDLTVVLITHEMGVIKEICDQVAVIEQGNLIEQGNVLDIFARPKTELTRRFVSSVFDYNLPPRIIEDIENGDAGRLVRVSFIEEGTDKPIISKMIRKFDIDANILYGSIDEIRSIPFGTLVLKLDGKESRIEQGIEFLQKKDLIVEVINDG
ncbi:ATP-binding cassette domain-containing protein [Halanaerobiaceae bacterium Z-7014]|uniref:ATP-binding cassette domain-containing protein n=1 Tax=Halonatronomonas betaini TaxID=2778430 RepID=A0A931F6Q8_9FIRM|nr:ATP-binding cassette domain-containing protein [Halonatronomonas betaini]MBF8435851.1 ATP-binding cassette domain-containing protein [Halonatronomonas betaini]